MKKYRVLVVDDEKSEREGIKKSLDETYYYVETADGLQQAMELFNAHNHQIVITDLCMPSGMEGMELLEQVKDRSPDTAVIIMTAYGDIEKAVKAMQLGALDFLKKPFIKDEIKARVEKATEKIDLLEDNKNLRKEVSDKYELIGNSSAIQELKRIIERVAKSDSWVLITGPHGSGKELIARAIQKASNRASKPFVRVNCAAIAETIIEAELFGAAKGAYTGAFQRKIGKFELADGGTIFLDEIGDMSLAAQAKVLRTLGSEEIMPVGGEKTIEVDVRVIAATNKDLPELVSRGVFREDLYYRLNTILVKSISLSARREDITVLIEHFLAQMGVGTSVTDKFSEEAIEYLKSWPWPGNVRELEKLVERAVVMFGQHKIQLQEVKNLMVIKVQSTEVKMDTGKTLKDARNEFEREYITRVLEECNSIVEAAERLGVNSGYLHQKIKDLGIQKRTQRSLSVHN